MNKKSTHPNLITIDPNIKTAIIYSIDDLFAYTVEIKEGNNSYYLAENSKLLTFGNIKEAKKAAVKENVREAYLALSKTYEETDLSTCHTNNQNHYDYSPITLFVKS